MCQVATPSETDKPFALALDDAKLDESGRMLTTEKGSFKRQSTSEIWNEKKILYSGMLPAHCRPHVPEEPPCHVPAGLIRNWEVQLYDLSHLATLSRPRAQQISCFSAPTRQNHAV